LKKEKGIKKGAHGINSDEHAKYSAEWRAYVKGLFDNLPPIKKEVMTGPGTSRSSSGTKYDSGGAPQPITLPLNKLGRFTGGKSVWSRAASWLKNAIITFGEEVELTEEDADKLMNLMNDGLNEIVGGQGHMTVTKDGGVAIIKTKDWQTYKAKGWVKKTNESLDLLATGDTTTSNASQEVEGEELNEIWPFGQKGKLPKGHWDLRGGAASKGMHKLRSGRDIPSTPQIDKIYKKVAALSAKNDHFGAMRELAKQAGDKQLVQIYDALKLMQDKYGVKFLKQNDDNLKNLFMPALNKTIETKFSKYAEVLRDAL
jgi:hypothetical protein